MKDLEEANIHVNLEDPNILSELEKLAENRHNWRHIVHGSMGDKLLEE